MKKGRYVINIIMYITNINLLLLSTPKVEKLATVNKNQKKLLIGRVTVDSLNVRAGVGMNYEVVGILQKDEEVIIEDEISYEGVPTWLKIRAPKNVKLYISKQFVNKVSNNKGIITDDDVNIRAKASLKSTVVNQLKKGTEIAIIKEEGDFYQIKPPKNTSLYVAKIYIDILGNYEPYKEVLKKSRYIKEQKWIKRLNELTLQIAQEHKKEATNRNYTLYIMELQKLEKIAPTNKLKNDVRERILRVKEFQKLVDEIRKKDVEHAKLLENISEAKPQVKELPLHEKPEPIQEEFTFKASGYLEGVGLYFRRPSPYKLINNRQIVCFIKTEKNLKKFIGKFVEVRGRNYRDMKGRNILELTDIKILDESF